MIRSNGRDVKDYFGIELFGANLELNLNRLSALICAGDFSPKRPFKYFEPKASLTQRTKSVLFIEDALLFQAIADTIATRHYKTLSEHNDFVFGSVLHPNVEKGLSLLEEPDSDFYFFQYYVPLYNKFINSINTELENSEVKYKLETDITGFFDCIPHSKLLVSLHALGVEQEILELLSQCLNLYSGTRESITPGVGIPQGQAASFFFANVFLHELDHLISQNGFTYYRYMDDIRIYEEDRSKLLEVLVTIDNFLKGKALSLNTKKTSIEEIGEDREKEKQTFLQSSYVSSESEFDSIPDAVSDQGLNEEQNRNFTIENIPEDELIVWCESQIQEAGEFLTSTLGKLGSPEFSLKEIMDDKNNFKKEIVSIAYKWRNANTILASIDKDPILDKALVPYWLFCLEHVFWKANHFCWNLNKYGADAQIAQQMEVMIKKFNSYEWVRFQILSNLANVQKFSQNKLKQLFRDLKLEKSPFVRLGYYLILLKNLEGKSQLTASVNKAIRDEQEQYIKKYLSSFVQYRNKNEEFEIIKYWFGL